MPSFLPSKWTSRLLPLAVAIVLVSFCEGSARLAIWWTYGSSNHQIQETLNYAPFLITAGRESAYSFRPRRPGQARVLWCGSSTAEQFTPEELTEAFGSILGRDAEVINIAQGGYNSTQGLVLLTLYGMQLRPDVIVTLDGINDIVSLTKTSQPGIPYLNLTIEQALTNPTAFWLNRMFASSQFLNALRKIGERQREVAVQSDKALIAQAVELYRLNVVKIACIANGIGAKDIAILQPYLHLRQRRPVRELDLSKTWEYRRTFMSTAMTHLNDAIRSSALPSNARYINGLAAFDESDGTVCFRDEAHLTPAGRRILLRRVISELRDGAPLAGDGVVAHKDPLR
jgi:lysophospholipase L1-like esterase